MFQSLPVRATRRRRRRGRPRMGTVRVDGPAAAGPLGHNSRGFARAVAVQRSQVSLGDCWSVCERRGSLSARGYLPVFSSPALLISATERRSAKKRLPQRSSRTQGCSGKQRGTRVAFTRRCSSCLAHAVPHADLAAGVPESGRMHHPAETTPPPRFPTSREPSWLAARH